MVVQLSEEGVSGSKIAELLQLNRLIILKFLKRFKSSGSVENKQRSGRPRKTDARAERRLIRIVKINPRKTLQDVTSVFNSQTPTKISNTTVKRRLQFHGYKRRVVKKKIVISKQNRVRQRAWCRTKLHMTVENYWRKVIYTDETKEGKTGKFMFGGKIMKNGFLGVLVNTVTPTPMSKQVSCFWGALHTTV